VRVDANPVDSVRDRLSAACTPWGWFSRSCGLVADSSGTWRLGHVLVSFRLPLTVRRRFWVLSLWISSCLSRMSNLISRPRLSCFYGRYHLLNLPEHWGGDRYGGFATSTHDADEGTFQAVADDRSMDEERLGLLRLRRNLDQNDSSVPGRIDGIDLEAIDGWEQP
jgi:hypothetical protein